MYIEQEGAPVGLWIFVCAVCLIAGGAMSWRMWKKAGADIRAAAAQEDMARSLRIIVSRTR